MSTTTEEKTNDNSFDEALSDDVSRILPAVKEEVSDEVNVDDLERNWIVEEVEASDEAKIERAVENAQNIYYKVLGRQWLDRHFVLAVKLIASMVVGGGPQSAYQQAIKYRTESIGAGYDNVVQFTSRSLRTTAEATNRLEGDPQPAPINRSYATPDTD